MDKDIIWCNIEPSVLNQTIHCPDGTQEHVQGGQLAAALIQKCKDYNKQEIYLFGYHPQFLSALGQEIEEIEKRMYNTENITIFCEGVII